MNSFAKLLLTVVLAGVTAFSIFGLLASFELGVNTVVWATGYGVVGLASAFGSIALGKSAISDLNTPAIKSG